MSDSPLPPDTPCPPAALLADCLQEVEETIDRLADLLAEARTYVAIENRLCQTEKQQGQALSARTQFDSTFIES